MHVRRLSTEIANSIACSRHLVNWGAAQKKLDKREERRVEIMGGD